MRALIASPWGQDFLKNTQAEFPQVEFVMPETDEERLAAAATSEIAIGRLSRELFLTAPKLRWIQSTSAGVEWMREVPELANSAVIVTNTRGAHASTIAEHTFGMLIYLARSFGSFVAAQGEQTWLHPAPRGVGLAGMTMGIIGLGNIGRTLAVRAHAFEMRVIAVDAHPVAQPDYVAKLGLLDDLHDLMRESDVVVVATPITEETRGMVGETELRLMKPDAYLMVISRGGIVDEATVVEMLHAGQLAGAGFDVTAVEPLPADDPLWRAPNVFITPHSSPSSEQTGRAVVGMVRENLRRYLAGEPLVNVVDKKLGY